MSSAAYRGVVAQVMGREGNQLVDTHGKHWDIFAEREVTQKWYGHPFQARSGSIYGPGGYVWNFRELKDNRYRCSINLRVPKWR